MDDEEIIYIAICNQIKLYNEALENNLFDPKEVDFARYILDRSLEIERKISAHIDEQEDTIKRPQW